MQQHIKSRLQKKPDVLTKEYIEWLDKFSVKYSYFKDKDMLDSLSDDRDIKNIKKIPQLYAIIEEYMNYNYIHPYFNEEHFGINWTYYIRYNDIGYELTSMHPVNFNSPVYVRRIDKAQDSFIDFNDIILEKEQLKTAHIRKKLQRERIKKIFERQDDIQDTKEYSKKRLAYTKSKKRKR